MRVTLLAFLLTGCVGAAQSARTLAPGKTEVTVSGSRNTSSDQHDDDPAVYSGQVMVRTGVANNADVGFEISRTPGSNSNVWALAVDPKVRLTGAWAQTTVSIGAPIGVFFEDAPRIAAMGTNPSQGGFDYGGAIAIPTLYVGQTISPTMELLIAPRLMIIKPDGGTYDDDDFRFYFGGSIGVRIRDPHRHWAVQPELGFTRVSAESDGADAMTILTLGLGLSVGN